MWCDYIIFLTVRLTLYCTWLACILLASGPINIFYLVANHDSFGQSVEKLYHLSYLVRDGTCALEFTPDGEPYKIGSNLTEDPKKWSRGLAIENLKLIQVHDWLIRCLVTHAPLPTGSLDLYLMRLC
ncbi:hypothetical protein BDR03DRAFT_961509 [Suillus americanus]|nr:hypothetical protein BDR03DRAFT_961509 [Suillus americanus]